MDILNWKLRGLGQSKKRRLMNNMNKESKADIVCLQESESQDPFNNVVKHVHGAVF